MTEIRSTTANSRLPQWGLTWLYQVQCFYQSLCLVDSEVLRNPPLRQAAKRYKQAYDDRVYIKRYNLKTHTITIKTNKYDT
jgi:hypothetical protein